MLKVGIYCVAEDGTRQTLFCLGQESRNNNKHKLSTSPAVFAMSGTSPSIYAIRVANKAASSTGSYDSIVKVSNLLSLNATHAEN
jgi:hypothetical protein